MVTLPKLDPVATPAAVTLATLASDEVHCAVLVTSCVLPSEKWAVAVNCCFDPMPMDIVLGVTCTDEIVGEPEPEPGVEPLPLPPHPVSAIRNISPQQSAAFIRILQLNVWAGRG
jgi:hypothetical protein